MHNIQVIQTHIFHVCFGGCSPSSGRR